MWEDFALSIGNNTLSHASFFNREFLTQIQDSKIQFESTGTSTLELLRWQQPVAIVNYHT
jgi:hypothetical protein